MIYWQKGKVINFSFHSNRFKNKRKNYCPFLGILIDISIKGIFRKNNIFLLISTILGTKERVQELQNMGL
ncbi:hypothetical protein Patl1_19516 [Pistacia atlantica]|uniref:Uncharacterized protein n=1 Tax=Pistacia atlantica TaxID=434234 RepID=A0ACC1BZN5_9ROSI|nr:hypothetical protein Patl1_19516 [Pistacia atlantica]